MKVFSVVTKSFKEQIRSFWILILTISMAPFFVFIYYLFTEAYQPNYELLVLNQDVGADGVNYGDYFLEAVTSVKRTDKDVPLKIQQVASRTDGIHKLKNRKADALVIIPEDFSKKLGNLNTVGDGDKIDIEFVGDLTNVNYMVSAIWTNEVLNEYLSSVIGKVSPVNIIESSVGISGEISEFDLYVPGLLILSIIMLMFSATIAFITEVENKTIIRLKLSRISPLELLTGISCVQIIVGILSILSTLLVAVWLGFNFTGSASLFLFIAVLTSLSIIAFSLIVAAATKTANEVLIVGNFPLFLFMFFTGAAFPIKGKALFTIASYPVTLQGLMSPTHAVTAMKKVLVMNMGFYDISPEITALIVTTILYFIIGVWLFKRRHMKVE